MEYEYNKYTCINNTLKETLEKYGVAIIPNLINENECEQINNGIWDYFEHITQNWSGDFSPIKKNDNKTWNNIFHLYPLHAQLFKHWSVGQSQVCWDTRQNSKIVNVFSQLWNCTPEEL